MRSHRSTLIVVAAVVVVIVCSFVCLVVFLGIIQRVWVVLGSSLCNRVSVDLFDSRGHTSPPALGRLLPSLLRLCAAQTHQLKTQSLRAGELASGRPRHVVPRGGGM